MAGMKLKTLLGLMVGGCFLGSVVFGQTTQFTGVVCSITKDEVTLQPNNDKQHSWTIKRTSNTTVSSGSLTVGVTVTIECPSPDAHKNETPCTPPSPTPPSG
jgi:hypothetical protein